MRGRKRHGALLESRNKARNIGSSSLQTTGDAVPFKYLEMVNEVTRDAGPERYDDSSDEHNELVHTRHKRNTKRPLPSLDDTRDKTETQERPARQQRRESSVIVLDSDSSCSERSTATSKVSGPPLQRSSLETVVRSSDIGSDSVGASSESEDEGVDAEQEEDEDSEWDTVEIGAQAEAEMTYSSVEEEPKAVEFTIGDSGRPKTTRTRKITREDRDARLASHMLHIICLLCHGSLRSKWCNDTSLKESILKSVPASIEDELNPEPGRPVQQRTRKFLDGLRHLMDFWNRRFRITYTGMSKKSWEDADAIKKDKNLEPPMELSGFRHALGRLEGSRDLGAQGYCALLRALGVRTRLVFSLQPVSFSVSSKSHTPKPSRASSAILVADPDDTRASSASETPKRPPIRLRKPRFSASKLAYTSTDHDKPEIAESPYPVFWIEAWDSAGLQWVSVDPMVLKLIEIAKSKSKFEPPQSELGNVMSYVIAFDKRGRAKDVTRRYAQHFNGKTRKLRITNEPAGQIWYDRVMLAFKPPYTTDIEQMEDAALLKRELAEDLPNNIQDFRGHPIFVLERHLRQNEIIHPKVPCGTIAVGRSKKSETEQIYRRRDLQTLRSAMQWYKIGRQVKVGEQPMKHIKRRTLPKTKSLLLDSDNEEDEEGSGEMALYAEFQTELYLPPAVVNGRLPRNDYGNLDVFVPSMVPAGAVHLGYRGIANAARVLGIDYVDAICGFDFQHRKATPRVNGIVVAAECEEAVMAVYGAMQEQAAYEEDLRRQDIALQRWRRYLLALRVKERVALNPAFRHMTRETFTEEDNGATATSQLSKKTADTDVKEGDDDSGGFLLEEVDGGDEAGGFLPDDTGGGDGSDDISGGGFMSDGDVGGGFLSEDENGEGRYLE
ncbi:uncharacterized protein V1518DRAFT_426170 [Limtongia smithiae]|uniref:uncharacterized protein n=1 Tax=Limtongia smithiae TaxID=1125753 RepID=UPI0034CD616F